MEKSSNISENEIKNLMKDSEGQSVDSLIKSRLTADRQKAVKSILSQPEKLQAILSSPAAKKLMEKLSSGEQ